MAVFVGDHGSAAKVVGMVEVESWRSVGCGLGILPTKSVCH